MFFEEITQTLIYSHFMDISYVYERQESNYFNISHLLYIISILTINWLLGNIICWYDLQKKEPEMAFSF